MLVWRQIGDLPLAVIGSGKPNPAFGADAEAFQEFWIEESRALAAKSTNGTFVVAKESSHYLHEDAPDMVLDAIRQMVDGLARSLLAQSIGMFRDKGMTETALGVDTRNLSGALHHKGVGYREGRRHTFFSKRMEL